MIIDGKKIADEILSNIKEKYEKLIKIKKRRAKLIVILVGDDYSSKIYIKSKEKVCKKIGIETETIILNEDISEIDLISEIEKYNKDEKVDGILLQLPLPKHLDQIKICSYISENKDVDGFNPINMGKLILNTEGLRPCTAIGVIELLNRYNIKIPGKDIVIIGRSNIVGKPLSIMLTNMSATVTVCHRKTLNIDEKIKNADIIISAAGYRNLINSSHKLKKGVTLIDVGINRNEDNKICGDISFDELVNNSNVAYITPVPGGVGPMTIAMLIHNLMIAYEKN